MLLLSFPPTQTVSSQSLFWCWCSDNRLLWSNVRPQLLPVAALQEAPEGRQTEQSWCRAGLTGQDPSQPSQQCYNTVSSRQVILTSLSSLLMIWELLPASRISPFKFAILCKMFPQFLCCCSLQPAPIFLLFCDLLVRRGQTTGLHSISACVTAQEEFLDSKVTLYKIFRGFLSFIFGKRSTIKVVDFYPVDFNVKINVGSVL